jgi:hypothetical protein
MSKREAPEEALSMRPDVETAARRVAETRARLARLPAGQVVTQEVEDALGDGYALALEGDAWLMHADERFEALIDGPSETVSGREVRALRHERQTFTRDLAALRAELALLRDAHERPALDAGRATA